MVVSGRKETSHEEPDSKCKKEESEKGKEKEEINSQTDKKNKKSMVSSVHVTLQTPKPFTPPPPPSTESVSSELFVNCEVEHEKTSFSEFNSSLLQKYEKESSPHDSLDDKVNLNEVSTMTPDEADKLLSTRWVNSFG